MAREHTSPAVAQAKHPSIRTRRAQKGMHPTQILQRLEDAPTSIRPADVLQLQRTIGNRATGQLLQAKLKLGPAGDRYEQEADQVAKQVVRASRQPDVQRADLDEEDLQAKPLAAGISQVQRDSRYAGVSYSRPEPRPTPQTFVAPQQKPQIQRDEMEDELQASANHGLEGGDVDADVARSIQSAKGGGQPLHDGVRSSMEKGFGADFGGVRVHTGGQADALNRSLNARAFTTGKDIFFGKGQYNPGSSGGQELIAHELTHTVQQGASQLVNRQFSQRDSSEQYLQRTEWYPRANGYYSHVLKGQKITQDNAVFTATAFKATGGGHSAVYIESLDSDGEPRDIKIDLHIEIVEEKDWRGQTVHKKLSGVNVQEGMIPRDIESRRRSWVRPAQAVSDAVNRANEIKQLSADKRKYRLFGGSFTKGAMNCAKFAERILKAAGIKASSGWIFKTPSELASGKNKGYQNTLDEDIESFTQKQEEEERERQKNMEKHKRMLERQLRMFEEMKANKEPENEEPENYVPVSNVAVDGEKEWLSKSIGQEFVLAQELPASRCGWDGSDRQPPTILPSGAEFVVTREGQIKGEVVIECAQPHGNYSVSASLLYAAVQKDVVNN